AALDELRSPLRHEVYVAVTAMDVQARAWITPKVVRLGASLGYRDLHPSIVSDEIQDVGGLGAAITLDGGQDAVVTNLEEVAGPRQIHYPPQNLQHAPGGTRG